MHFVYHLKRLGQMLFSSEDKGTWYMIICFNFKIHVEDSGKRFPLEIQLGAVFKVVLITVIGCMVYSLITVGFAALPKAILFPK